MPSRPATAAPGANVRTTGIIVMAWLILVAASVLEVVWAIAMKLSDGFTRPWPALLCVAAAAVSFYMLSVALRSLPVGTAYAVWVGIGTFGVVTVGILCLDDGISPARLLCLSLIVIGVIGLKFVEAG